MAIQNSRARKSLKGNKMEAEATVNIPMNGVEKTAPVPEVMTDKPNGIALANLLDKRDKMIQGLNSAKAQKDAVKQQLENIELAISRTEGAIYGYETLINELDPSVLQQGMGG
jgi:hypothetical protein